MLLFGWISDKIGRKFGMVRTISPSITLTEKGPYVLIRWQLLGLLLCFLAFQRHRPVLTIALLVSSLCSLHVGECTDDTTTFDAADQLGGVVSSSVSVSVQNIPADPSLHPSSQRKKASQRTRNIGGLPWLRVSVKPLPASFVPGAHCLTLLLIDTMIDFGFVVSSFVPLVLFWM